MMTPQDAAALLSKLGEDSLKAGYNLNVMQDGSWAFCPCCGTGQMKDYRFSFVVTEARNPQTNEDGKTIIIYMEHPSLKRRCLFGLAGSEGPAAQRDLLRLHGEAMQVLVLENLMRGLKS